MKFQLKELRAVFIVVVAIAAAGAAGVDPPAPDSAASGPESAPQVVAEIPGEVLVILEDGQSFQGVLRSQDDHEVVIAIAGIDTRFEARKVAEIRPLRTFDEYYDDLRFSIPIADADERFKFCQWIYQRGRLSLAETELQRLLDISPGHEAAKALLELVKSERAMREQAATDGSPVAGDNSSPAPAEADADVLLTEEEINLLRVYEINLAHPPRLVISRSVIDALFNKYGDSPLLPQRTEERKDFYAKSPVEILSIMFSLQARDLYADVRVMSEPEALNRFRLDVHKTWLVNSCATTECHGGDQAGAFRLISTQPALDRTIFTNLLILDRTNINGRPLLNYDAPADSLLLQSALGPDDSKSPHPKVAGWRPIFHNEQDSGFRKAVAWIDSMCKPRPVYPINLRGPWANHAAHSEPAAKPIDAAEPPRKPDR